MSALRDIMLQAQAGRRSAGRTTIDRNALLFFAGQPGLFGCCVLDLAEGGAGIRLSGLNILPLEFDLSFDNFRTIKRCNLIWRRDDFIGVAFTGSSPRISTRQ